MNILVTGGNGQIAYALRRTPLPSGMHLNFLSHQELDITDTQAIEAQLSRQTFNLIINTAAYTAVDEAEKNPDAAFAINHTGAENIAKACLKRDIPLLHLSTDYVFSGEKSQAYTEEDIPNPINIYGESKWRGEKAIQEILSKYIILRTSGVFSSHGNNFVKSIINLSKQKETLSVVNNQFICPTSAENIALTIIKIITKLEKLNNAWGIYHFCSDTSTNWYEFAKTIVDLGSTYNEFKLKGIIPVSSKQYASLATRPRNSVLNCKKIHAVFSVRQSSWQQSLPSIIIEIMGME